MSLVAPRENGSGLESESERRPVPSSPIRRYALVFGRRQMRRVLFVLLLLVVAAFGLGFVIGMGAPHFEMAVPGLRQAEPAPAIPPATPAEPKERPAEGGVPAQA